MTTTTTTKNQKELTRFRCKTQKPSGAEFKGTADCQDLSPSNLTSLDRAATITYGHPQSLGEANPAKQPCTANLPRPISFATEGSEISDFSLTVL